MHLSYSAPLNPSYLNTITQMLSTNIFHYKHLLLPATFISAGFSTPSQKQTSTIGEKHPVEQSFSFVNMHEILNVSIACVFVWFKQNKLCVFCLMWTINTSLSRNSVHISIYRKCIVLLFAVLCHVFSYHNLGEILYCSFTGTFIL